MKKKLIILLAIVGIPLVSGLYMMGYSLLPSGSSVKNSHPYRSYSAIKEAVLNAVPTAPVKSPVPTKAPESTTRSNSAPPATKPLPEMSDEEWGVAKQIGEHTFTIRLGEDDRMGTPQEIREALNVYRQNHSRSGLEWSDSLAAYAQTRADYFKTIQSTDAHEGLNSYLDNENGFEKLGFGHVGENSYFGGPLYAVHLIEWLFASSKGHDANQLDGSWSHVGVGVTDLSVNVIFGGDRL